MIIITEAKPDDAYSSTRLGNSNHEEHLLYKAAASLSLCVCVYTVHVCLYPPPFFTLNGE